MLVLRNRSSILGPTHFLIVLVSWRQVGLKLGLVRQFHAANNLKMLLFVKQAMSDLHLRHIYPVSLHSWIIWLFYKAIFHTFSTFPTLDPSELLDNSKNYCFLFFSFFLTTAHLSEFVLEEGWPLWCNCFRGCTAPAGLAVIGTTHTCA